MFASDAVLRSELTDELQHMILKLHIESQIMGLKMNMKKIKLMSTTCARP